MQRAVGFLMTPPYVSSARPPRSSGLTVNRSVVIVGAGIAGLMAGRHLQNAGHRVTILEKSRGVGGRMATRRTPHAVFDHGAQFITAPSALFADSVNEWLRENLLRVWYRGEGTAPLGAHPRYCGVNGMTTVPKHLAETMDIRRSTRAVSAAFSRDGWTVLDETEVTHRADAVILAAPVPQALALLEAGGVQRHPVDEDLLRGIAYTPCIAVLATLDGPSGLAEPGALQIGPEPIRWIADNSMKGISPYPSAVTIHVGPDYSSRLFELPDREIARKVLDECRPWINAGPSDMAVHRWRYSEPAHASMGPCYSLRAEPTAVLAGDAFGGGRVEGAALSGLAAAQYLCSVFG